MFQLYVDESGDEGDYVPSKISDKGGTSRYFTLGGIAVSTNDKQKFISSRKDILEKYFPKVEFHADFVLHYVDLRQHRFPYDKLADVEIRALADDIFKTIIDTPCRLFSVTIDLDKHCRKYIKPFNPRTYSLIIMIERFQYFLEDIGDKGDVIYEEFHSGLQRRTARHLQWVGNNTNFRSRTKILNVNNILSGDPLKEPMLEFADFFAYAPYKKCVSNGCKTARYDSIKHKYYQRLGYPSKNGFVEI